MNGRSDPLLLSEAITAAHKGGSVLRDYFQRASLARDRLHALKAKEKPGAGLVTRADTEAEAAIIKRLSRRFPNFGYIAEESGVSKHQSRETVEGRWIIDPLDGTTNFVHGFPVFCVSIAAMVGNSVRVGVIYHPILNETYYAVQGQGAFIRVGRKTKRLKISRTRKLQSALLTTGFTYRKERWLQKEMSAFESLSRIAQAVRRPGSAALDLAYTARGVFDGFWERNLAPWDIAAGALLVQEAGGLATDFSGQAIKLGQPKAALSGMEIIAANRPIHRLLRAAVNPDFCPV